MASPALSGRKYYHFISDNYYYYSCYDGVALSVNWVYGIIHKPKRIVVTLSIVQVYDRHVVRISCKERM